MLLLPGCVAASVIRGLCIRVRNGVLLAKPGAQIDEPAAITAEGAMRELIRPGDLEDGDLKTHIDFRRDYAAALDDWLGLPSRETPGGNFEPLLLFQG